MQKLHRVSVDVDVGVGVSFPFLSSSSSSSSFSRVVSRSHVLHLYTMYVQKSDGRRHSTLVCS